MNSSAYLSVFICNRGWSNITTCMICLQINCIQQKLILNFGNQIDDERQHKMFKNSFYPGKTDGALEYNILGQ